MSQRIAVLDYGMGNLRSVSKAIEHVAGNAEVRVTDDHEYIRQADRIVFPGQGAARDCMTAIGQHHLNQAILDSAKDKPFLGICMGLQILMEHSQENNGTDLLGIFKGDVIRFDGKAMGDNGLPLKIPHMGWSPVDQTISHPLWHGIDSGSRFYFVHSYYVQPQDELLTAATTDYGVKYVSAVSKDNLFAVQFHPEKSADAGLRLLENFVNWKI
jgi:imidazole glycerol-phosphate synthase subunit HisH